MMQYGEQLYLNRDYESIGGRQPNETPEMRGGGGATLGTRHPLRATPPAAPPYMSLHCAERTAPTSFTVDWLTALMKRQGRTVRNLWSGRHKHVSLFMIASETLIWIFVTAENNLYRPNHWQRY
ncbi:hypothetical protein E2C01_000150 [Portunus trituberculatus]|uniref:Uncharacterized protein n=1 Tax=Portunus trituberculatus TaxID=210409 RepID=A0A5B7CDW3_PORTR|nr:hypothetical protein [Portunus trituberculatus]